MARRPLRIAVWHNLSSGGAKRALYYHVRGLVERGHQVEAWCTPSADQEYLPLSSLIKEHVTPLDLTTPRVLRVLGRARLRHAVPRLMNAMDRHCRLVADAIGDDFDVVLASSCQFLAVAPLGLHVRPPSVLYLQEPNRRLYEAIRLVPWLDPSRVVRAATRRQGRAELAGVGVYDQVLVNSRFRARACCGRTAFRVTFVTSASTPICSGRKPIHLATTWSGSAHSFRRRTSSSR